MTVLLKRTNKLLLFYCNVKFQRREGFKTLNGLILILITQETRDISDGFLFQENIILPAFKIQIGEMSLSVVSV